MPSATDFFPAYITEFMNLVMMMFPNFGSGSTSRFSAEWRRDISSLPSSWSGSSRPSTFFLFVMPGLDPGIHLLAKTMDRRVKPGDDSQNSFRTLRAVLGTVLLAV